MQKLDMPNRSLPPRESFGAAGEEVELCINHVEMKLDPNNPHQKFYKYKFHITPEEKSASRRHRLVEILLGRPAFKALQSGIATDYSQNLPTVQQIEVDGTFITEEHPSSEPEFLQYFERGERPSDKSKRYMIAIWHNGSESMSELFKILKTPFDPNDATLDKAPLVQCVNIITTTTASEHPTTYDAGAHTKFFEWERKSQKELGFGLVAI